MPPEFDARAATLVHGVGQREAHPMGGSDDREDDENVAGEHLRGRSPADPTQSFERNRQNFRNGQERLRELASGVAGTEESLAATLHDLADRARLENRLDDARRLESQAEAALQHAVHERQEAERPVESPHVEPARVDVEQRRVTLESAREAAALRQEEAVRLRDEAARRRDEAARLRDEAARRRDAVAAERDERAVDRAVAAGRRDGAAEERQGAAARWEPRGTAPERGASPAGEEQAAVDEQVEATHRERAEGDRRQTAADRAADDDDRAEGLPD